MQGLSDAYRLTPLPAGGRVWPLDIRWSEEAPGGTDAALTDGGAAMPEYGQSRGAAAKGGRTLTGCFTVPGEAKGDLLLRFDGAGCFARLWLNQTPAAAHVGGHSVWECPLPAQAGETVAVTLALESGENVFSPYQTAGIQRGIWLAEVPSARLSGCIVRAGFKNGEGALRLEYAAEGLQPGDSLSAELFAPSGARLGQWPLNIGAAALGAEDLAVPRGAAAAPWSAEHPALYRLLLTLRHGNAVLETVEKRLGFTDIRMEDPQVLWNGRPLKLRGVNYREPLPAEGRSLRAELEALKQANINYLRSMYYPYGEECLNLCDELGFYVEQCAPFQEVGQGIASTQSTPAEADGYQSQFAEMLRDGISHPCVAVWCLGGDSSWGANFRRCYRLAKDTDPKRPVSFYYPMTIPEEEPELDIWSVAFVDWRQPMDAHYDQMTIFHTHGARNEIGYEVGGAASSKPVLHHTFAPPPCYNRDETQRDYGIHEFWGQSISRFWDKMWRTDGCLGGAVLAAADEDGRFSPRLKDFRWGILDAAGNPKPEYHHVRMAYAPVLLERCERRNGALAMVFRNRFCHTNLSELSCRWQAGGAGGIFALSAEPGESAEVRLTLPEGLAGAEIDLCFDTAGFGHRIAVPAAAEAAPDRRGENGGAYALAEDDARAVIENRLYRFEFDKRRGLLCGASARGVSLLAGGPFLQATRLSLGDWEGGVESALVTQAAARVVLLGAYGDVCRVRFTLDIGADGGIDARADILTLSRPMPHSVKAGVGIDPGGLNEWGIAWLAAPGSESLCWRRGALWSWYPQDHIGRPEGTARREDQNDFTAMKHGITAAALRYPGAEIAVPGGQGELSLRVEEQEDPAFVLDDRDGRIGYTGAWHEMDDYCGNYGGTESLSDEEGATAELRFTGSGVRVYGPKDFLYGEGEAAVDGGEASAFCQYIDRVDLPGASRGYEKRYGQLLYEVRGLPEGPHSLRVTVKGKGPAGAQGRYVSLDRIVVESETAKRPVRLVLNRDYNYARLVRGNYMRPRVSFAAGSSVGASICLAAEANGDGRTTL